MTQLLYPFVLGNMATGAYKFHTFELSWVKNNMMTFSVQAERNLQKILLDQLGSVAHCQMISYYHVVTVGVGWGGRYSAGKSSFHFLFKPNQIKLVVGEKSEVIHYPKSLSSESITVMWQFIQDDHFSKLAEPGGT